MATKTLKLKKQRARNGNASLFPLNDIVINGAVHIPSWVNDHDSFCRWACSDAYPERGQFFYLNGKLWADLSMETLIHNQIKGIFVIVLGSIALNETLGKYLGDRMMLKNMAASLSCEPDGMFISTGTLDRGLVTLAEGNESLEVLGTPDMALEVISKNSFDKDTVNLIELYAKAGVPEYWLVDSTINLPELVIMRLAGGKYVAARKHDGWVKSHVFNRSFRLTSGQDAKGLSHFNLETK